MTKKLQDITNVAKESEFYLSVDQTKHEPHYDVSRFIEAQKYDFDAAKKELANGKKETHWMWYMFPQVRGLGKSSISFHYGIENIEEAKVYFDNELLRSRLIELCNILLSLYTNNARRVFGAPDDLKLKSSMTLFYKATGEQIFKDILDKFFEGKLDEKTLGLL